MARRVAIIGAGASGLAAAVAAARAGARVELYEANDRVGRKLQRTGDGRCNFTNENVSPRGYNNPEFVAPLISEWPCGAIRAFFDGLGMLSVADADGRCWPATDKATTVIDVLRLECDHLGVRTRCAAPVSDIACDRGFELLTADGATHRTDAVVLACGDEPALLARLGIGRVKGHRVLCALKTDTAPIKGLSGTRVRCGVSLLEAGREVACERGELMFRDYGVSGITVFNLSRFADEGMDLRIDLFPDLTEAELAERLEGRRELLGWRGAVGFLIGTLLPKVADAAVRAAGLSGELEGMDMRRLACGLKSLTLPVCGLKADNAQVTRGGARVDRFDPRTCGSLDTAGLFVTGELLDIDGRCGGYNLHWAWASGLAAGRAAAEGSTTC